MIIEKKVWPPYFDDILSGRKKFEVRLADFACHEGDTLRLREWDPTSQNYTGREVDRAVTYVAQFKDFNFWSEADIKKYGWQIISLE